MPLTRPQLSTTYLLLVLTTLSIFSGPHWVFLWMMMELNLLAILPIMLHSFPVQMVSNSTVYFLAQTIGSSVLLLGMILRSSPWLLNYSTCSSLMIIFSLLLKLGAAPCYFWLPAACAESPWPVCNLILTWQKIIPLMFFLQAFTSLNSTFIFLIALINVLSGGVGGLNQTNLRPLFVFSSIAHLGWMFLASSFSLSVSYMYLIIYILSTGLTLMLMTPSLELSPTAPSPHTPYFLKSLLPLMMLLISLAGLPPFIGFYPKLLVLLSITSYKMFITIFIIVGLSVISASYYLRLVFMIIMSTGVPNFTTPWHSNLTPVMTLLVSSTIFGPLLLIMLLYALTFLHKP